MPRTLNRSNPDGLFIVGDRVGPKDRRATKYAVLGTVVEAHGPVCRVQWDDARPYDSPMTAHEGGLRWVGKATA